MTYINELRPPERMAELKRLYRGVFSTPEGKIVLTALLEDLGYFDQAKNDEERVLRNYANHLAETVFSSDSYDLVEAMMNVIDRRETNRSEENGRDTGD